jgi:hypothetical protein
MASPRITRILTEAMLKHLPPSSASLKLLDVGGSAQDILLKHRPDLAITPVTGDPATWAVEPASFDAVTAFDAAPDSPLLHAALAALRPGGRLIVMATRGEPDGGQVITLESHGFTRILVETGAECPLPVGVLMRGERPHTTDDTLARVQVAASGDADGQSLSDYRGRFVHLLIRQTPDKPAWKLRADEPLTWEAVTLDGALLAFSSLPKAVAFMQPVVLSGTITGVSKVAKFSKQTAQAWPQPVLLNPTPDVLHSGGLGVIPIDPDSAETPDE